MSTPAPSRPLGDGRPPHHAPANPNGVTYADSQIHLLDRLAVVYRHRAIAVSVFVLTALAVILQSYSAVQMYQAHARVLIEDERSTAVPGLTLENQYYEDPEPYYQTQYKILQGRDLARKVVRNLKLHTVGEFNGTDVPRETVTSMIRSSLRRALALARGRAAAPAAVPPPADETPDESALVDSFIGRVSVNPVRGTRLVDVGFMSTDPEFAARAANALAEEYVTQNLALKLQGTQNMLEWLDKELVNQQRKVQETEAALADYRERQNALSLDDKQNIVVQRLNKLNDDVVLAKTRKARAEVAYNQIRQAAPSEMATAPAIVQHTAVAQAKATLQNAQRERAEKSERYGEKHPEMQKAAAAVQEAQRQYELEVSRAAQSIKSDFDTAVLEEQTLTHNLNAAKADAQDLSKKSVDYNLMEREANSNRQVYEALLQREKELRVSSNSRANNVRIADLAEVPKAPMGTGSGRAWPIGLALGLVLGIAVPFLLDYINDSVKTPEDVTKQLKMPYLGLVPAVAGSDRLLLAAAGVPHDFGEAFRSLRTSIVSHYDHSGAKLVVFTSAQPLEGKTTTAVNTAVALALGGARVLIIDADMRRPGLHHPLRLRNECGLSQVLGGQARVRDVLQRTIDRNLLAITAGALPPNPSELLASERMQSLMVNLQQGPFDWIIIDTPPVLAVTDAVTLTPRVSGVVFVVGAEMTRRRLAERALETIIQTHPKQIGVVLNRVDFARNKYYYSRYYGYQHKNYYAQAV
jgi:capsular exopolysaccharide synthesis family protein